MSPAGRSSRRRSGGSKDIGTFDVQAGTFTYFCDIAGHRQGGMEGKLDRRPVGSGARQWQAAVAAAVAEGAAAGAPLDVEAGDLFFKPKDLTAKAGSVTINLTNKGVIQHNLVIQEDPSFKKIDLAPGGSGSGTFEAKPGSYTLYCDVAGHRPAGMEAKLTVS